MTALINMFTTRKQTINSWVSRIKEYTSIKAPKVVEYLVDVHYNS